MNKHMKDLRALKIEDLHRKEKELRDELVTIQKSIKLGNTQNYHAASQKKRDIARIKLLIAQDSSESQTVKKHTAKEKK